jgi:hypothetical protein
MGDLAISIQLDSNNRRQQLMREFFSQPENHSVDQIREFLEQQLGWQKDFLRLFLNHTDKTDLVEDEDWVLRIPSLSSVC